MLELNAQLFDSLNHSAIRYCHWKSNCRLDRSLEGRTDLDLLVAQEDQPAFESLLSRLDFRKVLTDPRRAIQDVDDHIGLDRASGRLVHLHVHYRLVLGERYIKNHALPLESLIFDNLVMSLGVKIPCPEIELLLLVIRANMKMGAGAFLRYAAGRLLGVSNTPYPADIVDEIKTLARACDPEKFSAILRSSGIALEPEAVSRFVTRACEGRLAPFSVLKWRHAVMGAMKGFRRQTGLMVRLRYHAHCLRALPLVNRFFSIRKKTLAGPGRIISIVGPDGAGKSTLVQELCSWLSWKLDVKRAYYGIPKTATVRAWRAVILGLKRIGLGPVSEFAGALYHVYIARKRYGIFKQTLADAASGRVVITDRFPMSEFQTMDEPMDGPRLACAQGFPYRPLSRLEAGYYAGIARPDRIFVLQADVSVLRARKGDVPLDQHRAKADAVNAIQSSRTVIAVDASRPYQQVLSELKAGIWEVL